ncbi:MAG: OmpA family protein [Acidobacteriaceae bacterium]|nr:OmpA family protein [Acidobacteriaceae bacterium]MBV9780664.1 OmpA family protein [Acidobacteriaceae bacterium]
MRYLLPKYVKNSIWILLSVLFSAALVMGMVEPNERVFTNGQDAKVRGVIVSKNGSMLKLRGDDDAIGTVDLTDGTKIEMKHGVFGWGKHAMDATSLVPGLHVEAQGKGNEKGELVASRVVFDPNSMRASRQIDTRVAPVEARTGTLENRAGQLENRAGQIENRQGQLEDTEKQTQQQVGQVKTEADQANQGVTEVNKRVSDLDNYEPKYSKTVYFKLNSAVLSPDAKRDLDELAQQALGEKGYMIEVAGFADSSGKADRNQQLSERRANAVIQYLEQQGNIPLHRILAPAGMGTSHAVADNNTREGRKQNRRVEVNVLVNQGVVASNAPTPESAK